MKAAALTSEEREAFRRTLAVEAWRRGTLEYLLHADQRRVLHQWEASRASRFVLEIARRWGKTWLLVVVALMVCLKRPRARVVYGAPTLKDLSEFILPTLEAINEQAPPFAAGTFNAQTGHWTLPNGSYIHLFGCDDKRKANRGRGASADLVILDEAGFIPILRYVLKSVLRPQTLHTGGKTLIASTPAEEPDHDFTELAIRAENRGAYARRTIHDNPRLTKERIAAFIAEDAADEGMSVEAYQQTDTFRREHLAERVIDRELVVIPEWQDEALRSRLFIPSPKRPAHFDAYESLDFGGADPHFALLGYYDFPRAKLVIEGELCLHEGQSTLELAHELKAKEQALWGVRRWDGTLRAAKERHVPFLESLPDWLKVRLDAEAEPQPFARYADNDLQLIRDLFSMHGLLFAPTAKADKALHVNAVRVALRQERIEVSSDCIHLDRHLRTTLWANAKRTDFARRAGEHGDGVDALTYLHRNVDAQRNPFPPAELTELERRRQALAEAQVSTLVDTPLARKLARSLR